MSIAATFSRHFWNIEEQARGRDKVRPADRGWQTYKLRRTEGDRHKLPKLFNGRLNTTSPKVQHLNYIESLHKLTLYSFQKGREPFITAYVFSRQHNIYSAEYRWYTSSQYKNLKPPNTWNTLSYRAPKKQIQHNTLKRWITSCICMSLVCTTCYLNISKIQAWFFIPWWAKILNYVTTVKSNSIVD